MLIERMPCTLTLWLLMPHLHRVQAEIFLGFSQEARVHTLPQSGDHDVVSSLAVEPDCAIRSTRDHTHPAQNPMINIQILKTLVLLQYNLTDAFFCLQ